MQADVEHTAINAFRAIDPSNHDGKLAIEEFADVLQFPCAAAARSRREHATPVPIMARAPFMKSIKSNILAFAVLATLIPSIGLGLISFVGYQDVINRNVD